MNRIYTELTKKVTVDSKGAPSWIVDSEGFDYFHRKHGYSFCDAFWEMQTWDAELVTIPIIFLF